MLLGPGMSMHVHNYSFCREFSEKYNQLNALSPSSGLFLACDDHHRQPPPHFHLKIGTGNRGVKTQSRVQEAAGWADSVLKIYAVHEMHRLLLPEIPRCQ